MNILLVLTVVCCTSSLVNCQYDDDDYTGRRPVEVEVGDDYSHYGRDPHPYTPYPPHRDNYGYQPKGKIDCGPLYGLKNGKIEIVPDTKLASIATYICDEGFVLTNRGTRVCTYRGKWSGVAPKCVKGICSYLPTIPNGRVIVSGQKFRDTATYLCKEGFDLIGARQRKCDENEDWVPEEPKCEKITCPKLSPPSYGKVFVSGRLYDDIAVYRCSHGFIINGNSRRECLRTGEWSGTDPTCEKPEPIRKKPYGDYGYGDNDYDDYDYEY